MAPLGRLEVLNSKPLGNGEFVLYWMQASHRAQENWALDYAIEEANLRGLPVVVFFGLTEYPEANLRHYLFMLQGLREAKEELRGLGIRLVIQQVSPELGVLELAKKASQIVVDKAYLRTNRQWVGYVAKKAQVPLVQVEDNAVIPVEEASQKEEYTAATLRPKILAKLNNYLEVPPKLNPKKSSLKMNLPSLLLTDLDKALSGLKINRTVDKAPFQGGTSKAKTLLETFIAQKLETYEQKGSTPDNDCASELSPFLHFGQISPIYVAARILKTNTADRHRFLEQLIVRRELAINFAHYNPNYDSIACLPRWAQETLNQHATDQRSNIYSPKQLENAQTHDPYWNAAQKEMTATGKMNGYMRMYWGKKIIEWTQNPEEAYKTTLYLNNKYELDGRDPNGYAGVAWCFGKHDRPWKEREIFGKVRFMNSAGLQRKFDMNLYLQKVNTL
ncbi:MAG: deoxyribodipyrimidine photo-lyase [Candidatus Bathyarchaeota archaeon]|nr:deoxyribodipyrimidine photo-lyase [Candidatus Bathyarchaeota archaeon]